MPRSWCFPDTSAEPRPYGFGVGRYDEASSLSLGHQGLRRRVWKSFHPWTNSRRRTVGGTYTNPRETMRGGTKSRLRVVGDTCTSRRERMKGGTDRQRMSRGVCSAAWHPFPACWLHQAAELHSGGPCPLVVFFRPKLRLWLSARKYSRRLTWYLEVVPQFGTRDGSSSSRE